jgi:hypothetical protein
MVAREDDLGIEVMTKGTLTTRQQLAEQLTEFIRTRGGWATNPLPLRDFEHLRFEVRLSDNKLPSDLTRLGFEIRLLCQSTRLDPWATTEIIRVGNSQQLRRHAGIVDICVYEIQLPGSSNGRIDNDWPSPSSFRMASI